jgi:hypothetical protein
MSAPSRTRYCVLYWQESRCKVEIPATSEAQAIAFVRAALESGTPLNATVFDGDYAIVSAEAIDDGGAS